ncbi:MAG: spore maturation protein [Candidatus Sumerlaeia bacterium]|nr:spore maturation protein [Candidatus Sumerlaeia bacterium]
MQQIADALLVIANWGVPVIMITILLYGFYRGVKVYEVFIEGAKEGFQISVTIMPYLVAMLVAIGMLRDIGLLSIFSNFVNPITSQIYMPAEILPMAILRPLSGSGASAFMNSIFLEYGPDSYNGILASVLMGSTETTFYIIAVYFGAVNITKTRHAVAAGLVGDVAGMLTAVLITYVLFRHLYPL